MSVSVSGCAAAGSEPARIAAEAASAAGQARAAALVSRSRAHVSPPGGWWAARVSRLPVGVHDEQATAPGGHAEHASAEQLVGETARRAQRQRLVMQREAQAVGAHALDAGVERAGARRGRRGRPSMRASPGPSDVPMRQVREPWPTMATSQAVEARVGQQQQVGEGVLRADKAEGAQDGRCAWHACSRATRRQSSMSLSSLSRRGGAHLDPQLPETRQGLGRQRIEVADDDVRAHAGREAACRATVGGDDPWPLRGCGGLRPRPRRAAVPASRRAPCRQLGERDDVDVTVGDDE